MIVIKRFVEKKNVFASRQDKPLKKIIKILLHSVCWYYDEEANSRS